MRTRQATSPPRPPRQRARRLCESRDFFVCQDLDLDFRLARIDLGCLAFEVLEMLKDMDRLVVVRGGPDRWLAGKSREMEGRRKAVIEIAAHRWEKPRLASAP